MERTRQVIFELPREEFPILHGLATRGCSFETEVAKIRHAINHTAEVVDDASAALRAIRERLRKLRHRLRGMLESYIRGRDTSRYLQEQIVTDRAGRYVLVVRSEHRSAIPGIIHGSSTSGASLFLEPLSTVELNNNIVALEEQERNEICRILLALTDAFRRRASELHHTIEAATEIDTVQAKARFSQLVDGIEPVLSEDGRLELRAARHPLLMEAVTSRVEPLRSDDESIRPLTVPRSQAQPVPIDLVLIPPVTALVVTGPNTGGKTVALKTAGLLALMAQAGLHVPAASGARLPVFRSVFADIGDEQSIATNLSTFSWHVTNITAMDRALILPALVLLDEVGAGTDPHEGGALGTAIIDHFKGRHALVVATTHDEVLKTYASTTKGVATAAFGFDPDTFAPTYILHYGSPGRSLAFEIAARLGLAQSIVEAARQRRSARETQLAEHLAKVEDDLRELDGQRRTVSADRQQLATAEADFRSREKALRDREDALRRRQQKSVDDRIGAARHEIDAIVDAFKQRAASVGPARLSGRPSMPTSERGAARMALEAVAERFRDRPADHGATVRPDTVKPARRPAVGEHVEVGSLGVEGIVLGVNERDAELAVRGKRLRTSLDDLRTVEPAPAVKAPQVEVRFHLQPRDGTHELNVIGCSVDEAVARTEQFLDGALVSDLRLVRVIHGHGTGQLRRAIADLLDGHQLVERFQPARPEEGGRGVTVVELKG